MSAEASQDAAAAFLAAAFFAAAFGGVPFFSATPFLPLQGSRTSVSNLDHSLLILVSKMWLVPKFIFWGVMRSTLTAGIICFGELGFQSLVGAEIICFSKFAEFGRC